MADLLIPFLIMLFLVGAVLFALLVHFLRGIEDPSVWTPPDGDDMADRLKAGWQRLRPDRPAGGREAARGRARQAPAWLKPRRREAPSQLFRRPAAEREAQAPQDRPAPAWQADRGAAPDEPGREAPQAEPRAPSRRSPLPWQLPWQREKPETAQREKPEPRAARPAPLWTRERPESEPAPPATTRKRSRRCSTCGGSGRAVVQGPAGNLTQGPCPDCQA